MKKNDLRVKRTNKMIVEAFIKLVEAKGYEQITIQDIADEAMINRATFYAHYKDKLDLYETIFDEAISAFTDLLSPNELVLTQIFQATRKNRLFYLMIMESSSSDFLHKKLADIIYNQYAHTFAQLKITENEIEVPMDFIINYMTAIFISTLHWWLTTNSEMTPNHLAQLVIKLVGNGHLTVLGLKIDN